MCYQRCPDENYDGECTARSGQRSCEMDEANEPDFDSLSKDERSEIEAANVFIK